MRKGNFNERIARELLRIARELEGSGSVYKNVKTFQRAVGGDPNAQKDIARNWGPVSSVTAAGLDGEITVNRDGAARDDADDFIDFDGK